MRDARNIDPDSCKQAIKRVHCQSYWNNCLQPIIDPINVEENGWEIKERICPVWFTGPQLPPSCSKKKKTQVTNYEGDKDSDTSLKKPPKERVKSSTKDAISSKTKKEWKKLLKESGENLDSESDDYDADVDAPSVEVESNDNFSSSYNWD